MTKILSAKDVKEIRKKEIQAKNDEMITQFNSTVLEMQYEPQVFKHADLYDWIIFNREELENLGYSFKMMKDEGSGLESCKIYFKDE